MARAFEEILGDRLTAGVTIIKIKEDIDVQCLKKTEIFVGGHPLPNEEGVEGCKRMLELADQMNEKDLLLLGLTGGCSALILSREFLSTTLKRPPTSCSKTACG